MNNVRVLAIEDDPNDILLIERTLRNRETETFEITSKTHLTSGLESLASERFDVVLLDLRLPDSVGVDTVQRVRDVGPGTAILVLTGHTDERIALQALRCGADDYLSKAELGTGALPRAIRYAVERRHAQAQLHRAEQLEMLNQLTAAAMHEFSNLVQIITGNIELLPDLGMEAPSKSRVESIRTALRRMTAINNNLLKFTREQSNHQLPRVDLGTALANVQRIIDRNSLDGGFRV